ncbi:hypothetical protein P280DRAFT_313169 [Massarina eburnea CBS 473.64]|uniref:Uncharacterized protein n=1 Tax=Massarina eburnea CBS 473.64 TaxID=1395130 RepID=A0A6A6S1P1_9PLEO|nr:hypothetical protein P280DRAFT_313169 [Massarina eburnea CBS 473.64]
MNTIMPEKSGWRKKAKQRTKDSKANNDNLAPADDTTRRPGSGWRKSHAERPETPATPSIVVTEDIQSEAPSEANSPRRSSMPKLVRYLSGLHTKDHLKHINFNEDWWNEVELVKKPPVDPALALQSTFSHMRELPSKPIPVSHFSGLFHLFEDYRKIREERDTLAGKLGEMSQQHAQSKKAWVDAEFVYQTEIRRLELLIAHGASGMVGLAKARMDSVVKRKKVIGRKSGRDKLTTFQSLPEARLEEQTKARSRNVFRQRPSSSAADMVALSRRFSAIDAVEDVPIGTPPMHEHNVTLSRKVKSELNMLNMGAVNSLNSAAYSADSEFSWTGDPLPDEIDAGLLTTVDSSTDYDALAALRELGGLVAQKKGINLKRFMTRLMELLSENDAAKAPEMELNADSVISNDSENELMMTPNQKLRHAQSHPLLGSAYKRRRHFSFEPGDDLSYPKALVESSPESSPRYHTPGNEASIVNTTNPKPSKIPSPAQRSAYGSARREGSVSSLQSIGGRFHQDDRRDSRSSILTAFRESSRGGLHPVNSGSVHAAVRAFERSRTDNKTSSSEGLPNSSV